MLKLEDYDAYLIEEIAAHMVEPNPLQRVMALAGKPIDKIIDVVNNSKLPVLKEINSTITSGVEKALKTTIKVANKLCSERAVLKEYSSLNVDVASIDEVKYLSIEPMDKVADRYDLSNAVFVGLEGSLLGAATTLAEGVPLAQLLIPSLVMADVSSSMVLLSRHVCQIATCYGYSSEKPINLPHILAAMAPTNNTSDEGYFVSKEYAVASIREAGKYLAQNTRNLLDKDILNRAPQLVKLITYLTERLGLTISQKELALLVPVAGAVINGGVNIAFQQAGHTMAKDYFRQLILEERYGSMVQDAINSKIEELRLKKKAIRLHYIGG